MRIYRLETEQTFRKPLVDVFPFFAEARNLEAITPPWLHFRILTPGTIEMRVGTLIDYRLRLHGVPFRWRTEITAWEPPYRFVDEQIRGPYRLWVHEHRFTVENGRTVVRDTVRFAAWGGPLLMRAFVVPRVERIFRHRHGKLDEIFGEEAPASVRVSHDGGRRLDALATPAS
jgi:ligand-binding SRPBCC domain-containing protein